MTAPLYVVQFISQEGDNFPLREVYLTLSKAQEAVREDSVTFISDTLDVSLMTFEDHTGEEIPGLPAPLKQWIAHHPKLQEWRVAYVISELSLQKPSE